MPPRVRTQVGGESTTKKIVEIHLSLNSCSGLASVCRNSARLTLNRSFT